jgi:hypothetical protein
MLLSTATAPVIAQTPYCQYIVDGKERQTELALRIEQHAKGEDEFRTTLESLISWASRAAALLEASKVEQKRQLIAFVFSNLRLRGEKLEFPLRSPFSDRRQWLSTQIEACSREPGRALRLGRIPSAQLLPFRHRRNQRRAILGPRGQ